MYKLVNCTGQIGYEEGLKLQQDAFQSVLSGQYKGVLIVLEHKPVYTLGTDGGRDNFLIPMAQLEEEGVDVVQVDRGGNVTYHGPGQLVAYPIFQLSHLKKDAHWYIDCLEQVVIDVISQYGISGSRKPEYRGVWVEDKKISAVGVHVKKWITSHGLSFNINPNKEYFSRINPCGIVEFGIASLEDYVENVDIETVRSQLIEGFQKVFDLDFDQIVEYK